MGTNYYIRKKVDSRVNSELIDLINRCEYFKLQERVNSLLEGLEVHIGKSSCGWRFSFQYLDEFDKNNLSEETMYTYLAREIANGAEFINEYEEPVTLKSFKKLVASKRDSKEPEVVTNYLPSLDNSRWTEGDFC